jgi:hypothetical protein
MEILKCHNTYPLRERRPDVQFFLIIFGHFKDFWDESMYKNHVETRVYGCDCRMSIFKILGIIS